MPDTPTVLRKIAARKVQEVAERRRAVDLNQLRSLAAEASPARGFAAALASQIALKQPAVIAEIKRASPSRGVIRDPYQPADIAASYARAGATCLSVLTDVDFFQGSDAHLREVRATCELPILRKDFVIDPYQIWEARALGADCILLIAALHDGEALADLAAQAQAAGLDVLIEVHNEQELQRVLPLEPSVIGINNRDLHTFDVDLETTRRLLPHVPEGCAVVTESGIMAPADVAAMCALGIFGFLVGEAFMRQDDPGAGLKALFFS